MRRWVASIALALAGIFPLFVKDPSDWGDPWMIAIVGLFLLGAIGLMPTRARKHSRPRIDPPSDRPEPTLIRGAVTGSSITENRVKGGSSLIDGPVTSSRVHANSVERSDEEQLGPRLNVLQWLIQKLRAK
jgi:hypothetical protein